MRHRLSRTSLRPDQQCRRRVSGILPMLTTSPDLRLPAGRGQPPGGLARGNRLRLRHRGQRQPRANLAASAFIATDSNGGKGTASSVPVQPASAPSPARTPGRTRSEPSIRPPLVEHNVGGVALAGTPPTPVVSLNGSRTPDPSIPFGSFTRLANNATGRSASAWRRGQAGQCSSVGGGRWPGFGGVAGRACTGVRCAGGAVGTGAAAGAAGPADAVAGAGAAGGSAGPCRPPSSGDPVIVVLQRRTIRRRPGLRRWLGSHGPFSRRLGAAAVLARVHDVDHEAIADAVRPDRTAGGLDQQFDEIVPVGQPHRHHVARRPGRGLPEGERATGTG